MMTGVQLLGLGLGVGLGPRWSSCGWACMPSAAGGCGVTALVALEG